MAPQIVLASRMNDFRMLSLPSQKFPCITSFDHSSVKSFNTFRKAKCLTKAGVAAKTEEIRPLGNFSPSIWGPHFTTYSFNQSEFTKYSREVEELRIIVKNMLNASRDNISKHTELIDSLCRLGISYHFEDEIKEQLNHVFHQQHELLENKDYDLYTAANIFRVYRQHGYKVSCNIFEQFKDDNDEFDEILTHDIKGLLSLYEASYLGVKGEDIIEEALDFATSHLKSLRREVSPSLSRHISSALDTDFYKGMPRLQTRKYIDIYQESEHRNEAILKFAKLDFNRLQLLHQQELSILTNWWNNLKIVVKLDYIRDRVVEAYFWAIGMYFEPKYWRARIIFTKTILLISILDDTYDSYGKIDELQLLTDALERWELSAIEQLPAYLIGFYKEILDTYNQFNLEVKQNHTKNEFIKLARAYNVEARWSKSGYDPTFDEYMKNARVSAAVALMSSTAFIGMGETKWLEAYRWFETNPQLITTVETAGRYLDDIGTYEDEQKRGDINGIPLYMKDYGVSEKEAVEVFRKRSRQGWEDLKEECFDPVSVDVPAQLLNLLRIGEVVYQNGTDSYTNPELLKDTISKLFVHPVSI